MDSPRRFSTSSCFHNSNLPGPLTNVLICFSILVRNSPSYSNLSISPEYKTPASHSPRVIYRVSKSPRSITGQSIKNLPKHDSPGYNTSASQLFKPKIWLTQADSNNEKNVDRKSRWTVPLSVCRTFKKLSFGVWQTHTWIQWAVWSSPCRPTSGRPPSGPPPRLPQTQCTPAPTVQ